MKEIDDQRRAAIIETGLAGEFWQEILLPLITNRQKSMEIALRNPSLTRKHEVPDDYCRGQLEFADLMLDQPRMLAESIRMVEIEEKLEVERQRNDDLRAHYGLGYNAGE